MAKRKGSSVSRPRSRNKMAKGGSEAKTTSAGCIEDECDQLEREIIALKGEHAEVEELLRPLICKEEQLKQSLITKKRRIEEVKNARRLDKLPREVWEKILDNLDENDLFPLALSCRYFRQKQKELVARTRQKGKPCRALKTTLHEWPVKDQPASAEYLEFCYIEKYSGGYEGVRDKRIRIMAAYHGHLPLLQELLEPFDELDKEIVRNAGESSSSQSLLLLLGFASDFVFFAARGGQLETLQWLKTQEGFEMNESVFLKACENGHLEMMKWLRSEGCPLG